MCGRFVSTSSTEEVAAYFGAVIDDALLDGGSDAVPDGGPGAVAAPGTPNFNVAPTTDVLAVVAGGQDRTVRAYRWGLVPSWAKDVKVGSRMINARAETIADKPVFAKPLRNRRLIVPMSGFYEWQVVPGQKVKQPMFIHRVDGEPLAVAGLWAAWRDPSASGADWLRSCTVITTTANATMAAIHDRMPVVLPASRWEAWLDPGNDDVDSLRGMLVPAAADLLTMRPVSTDVNSVRNNGPELLAPV